MGDEESSLVRAILAAPGDDALRLVYADWLEERGDARAEYLRLLYRLSGPATADARDAVLECLDELRKRLDPQWVGLMHRGRPLPTAAKLPPLPHCDYGPRCPFCSRRKPRLDEASVSHFVQQYRRPGGNDRHYSRELEKRIKRLKPEDLDRLLRGDGTDD